MTEPNDIFIAYELWHVEEARSRAARRATIVCLDFWVGKELKKENINCISLLDLAISDNTEEEWWLLAQNVAREWYRLPSMKFFEHDGIRIAEVIEPIMATYLSRLFYYTRIFIALKKAYPVTHVYIPALTIKDAPTDECLVNFERLAVVDAAHMVGLRSNVLDKPIASRTHPFLRTAGKSILTWAYNMIIGFVPRCGLKIYAGEYWSHIAPVIEKMDDVELVLMESGALKHIHWRQLLKHRIHIRHPNDEICVADRQAAIRISKEFLKKWEDAKKDVAQYLSATRRELDWSPVLQACEYLMTFSQRVIADIDALNRIMKEEKPDIMLQSASVGGRHHHFFLMARIAAQLKIPSVELQHATAYIDPRSANSRLETDYLGTYGTDTNSWRERIGHAHNQLVSIGSPRFDKYLNEHAVALEKGKQLFKQVGLDTNRPVLLVAVPFSSPSVSLFTFDSYQLAEFFEAIRSVQRKIPGMQVLFKCRNYRYVNETREYLNELFHADSIVTGNEDIFPLLCASDAVVCGNSTVLFQTMLAKKPLVLYPWKFFDTYHSQVYASAVPLVRTEEEAVSVLKRIFGDALYRKELLARQGRFLKRYSFDGRASERTVEFIGKLARKRESLFACHNKIFV